MNDRLALYARCRKDGTDRVIAAIVLGQQLDWLTNPEWVLIAVDDVLNRWHQRLDQVAEEIRRGRTSEAIDAELTSTPDWQTFSALHWFVDHYVEKVEATELPANPPPPHDPDMYTATQWFRHVQLLTPPGHRIHTSKDARLGRDAGL